MMEAPSAHRGRAHQSIRGSAVSRNRHWVAGGGEDSNSANSSRSATPTNNHHPPTWKRAGNPRGSGGGRGSSRGGPARKFPNASLDTRSNASTPQAAPQYQDLDSEVEEEEEIVAETVQERQSNEQEEIDRFWYQLVREREVERKRAIAEGKMDDPLVAKRLEDAITVVGTCMDMCPRHERYRREREHGLALEERIPGTKFVDHKRAVKQFERGVGDKTLPSDIRPAPVLKKTLDYLIHDILDDNDFAAHYMFIRDRSRAVRNDFTLQRDFGPTAFECLERCARFHILSLHLMIEDKGTREPEEKQLGNTLQSLKEFAQDQRGAYVSPHDFEIRIYHRLFQMRNQTETDDDIPASVRSNPIFTLVTAFRKHIQKCSAPINKLTALKIDERGIELFGELARELRSSSAGGGERGMVYLMACILEYHFGAGTVPGIEELRGGMRLRDVIDGVAAPSPPSAARIEEVDQQEEEQEQRHDEDEDDEDETDIDEQEGYGNEQEEEQHEMPPPATKTSAFPTTSSFFPAQPAPVSVFANLKTTPNAFGASTPTMTFPSSSTSTTGYFGSASSSKAPISAFGAPSQQQPQQQPSSSSSFTSSPSTRPTVSSPLNPNTNTSTTTSWGSSSASGTTQPNFFGAPAKPLAPTPPNTNTNATSSFAFLTQPSNSFGSPLTRINTDTTNLVNGALDSPRVPPPLPKQGFVPLPGTPLGGSSFAGSSSPTPDSSFSSPPFGTGSSGITSTPSNSTLNFSGSMNGKTSTNPRLGLLKTEFSIPGAGGAGGEMLSPLVLNSPSGSMVIPNVPGKSPSKMSFSTTTIPNGKEPVRRSSTSSSPAPSLHALEKQFAVKRDAELVRRTVRTWQRRTTDREVWAEACRKSDAYSARIRGESESGSASASASTSGHRHGHSRSASREFPPSASTAGARRSKRARPSEPGISGETPSSSEVRSRKRMKKQQQQRMSAAESEKPRTDEELARRFRENQEEHERRWAPRTFLGIIETHAEKHRRSRNTDHDTDDEDEDEDEEDELNSWRIWLSTNPVTDATAIWVEKKFDIKSDSTTEGEWISETIFAMPLGGSSAIGSSGCVLDASPGIVVFECTPLEGVRDELDRKFYVLDDCARLRDLVQAFPPRRAFAPSILLVNWVGLDAVQPDDEVPKDIVDMLDKLVQAKVVRSFRVFSLTSKTKDLDRKFDEAVDALDLDFAGSLVVRQTLSGVFKSYEPPFREFITEWIGRCFDDDDAFFDWVLYARTIHACVVLLTEISQSVLKIIGVPPFFAPLPSFDAHHVTNSYSAYDAVIAWLDDIHCTAAANIAQDLISHRDLGRDFPHRDFLDLLHDLAIHQTMSYIHTSCKEYDRTIYILPADQVEQSVATFKASAIATQSTRLVQSRAFSARRSPPKRRGRSASSASFSRDSMSPSSSKRAKLSSSASDVSTTTSASPRINGRSSPSPSASAFSTADTDAGSTDTAQTGSAPVVTVAMLRALTRDLTQKFRK